MKKGQKVGPSPVLVFFLSTPPEKWWNLKKLYSLLLDLPQKGTRLILGFEGKGIRLLVVLEGKGIRLLVDKSGKE